MLTASQIIEKRKQLWEANASQSYDIQIDKDREYREFVAQYIARKDDPGSILLRQEIQLHPECLIQMLFVIVDKNQKTVPFFGNEVQHKFQDYLNKAIEEFKAGQRFTVAFLINKGRQQGFTSWITAYQLACSVTKKNFHGLTIADNAENVETIFSDKAKFTFDELPDIVKPTQKANNRRELIFRKEDGGGLNSRWRVAVASKRAGQSKTLNFFHGSESAFWPSLGQTLTALDQALTRDAIKILESTANGYNEYKELWDQDNNWQAIFFSWWETSEYRAEFENAVRGQEFKQRVVNAPEGDFEPEVESWVLNKCRWLHNEIKLEWNQVYWYYQKWRSFKTKRDIMQEYPCTPEEAFLASGNCIFSTEIITNRMAVLRERYKEQPYRVGRFDFKWRNEEFRDKIIDESIKWVDDPNGWIRLYEEPMQGYYYAGGGDTKGDGSDFFTGTIKNNITHNRAMTLHKNFMDGNLYAHQMYCIGRYYNNALLCIETNWNTGPIDELQRLKYGKLYVRRKFDDMTKKIVEKFGFRTDGSNRNNIIDKQITLMREHADLFNDIHYLQECLTFVYDKDMRPDAESGKHDDILFSDMLAEEAGGQQKKSLDAETVELKGWYTESELEDKGYKPYEIKKIMEGMKPWK